MRQRELRHDIQILVDVEQLVAERRKDDASDIGPRERGVEHIRVFGQSDAQCRLGRRQSARSIRSTRPPLRPNECLS